LEISEPTFHRWRHFYGGMKGPEMARVNVLENENARLKKIVAHQAMDIDALKDLSRKNW
jgi:putative transposase